MVGSRPSDMWRVSVVGNSGSGKTRVAAAIAARLGAPHVELDALFHQPDWQPLPEDAFRARVAEITAGESWVIDGNYSAVRDLVWARADTVVWLDYPRSLVMRRVVARTLARVILRRRLWNGNREPWMNLASTDPEKSIIAWAWTQHDGYRQRYGEAARDPALGHLAFVRLRSSPETNAFLSTIP
jgi:adenylate kinase family enzyme